MSPVLKTQAGAKAGGAKAGRSTSSVAETTGTPPPLPRQSQQQQKKRTVSSLVLRMLLCLLLLNFFSSIAGIHTYLLNDATVQHRVSALLGFLSRAGGGPSTSRQFGLLFDRMLLRPSSVAALGGNSVGGGGGGGGGGGTSSSSTSSGSPSPLRGGGGGGSNNLFAQFFEETFQTSGFESASLHSSSSSFSFSAAGGGSRLEESSDITMDAEDDVDGLGDASSLDELEVMRGMTAPSSPSSSPSSAPLGSNDDSDAGADSHMGSEGMEKSDGSSKAHHNRFFTAVLGAYLPASFIESMADLSQSVAAALTADGGDGSGVSIEAIVRGLGATAAGVLSKAQSGVDAVLRGFTPQNADTNRGGGEDGRVVEGQTTSSVAATFAPSALPFTAKVVAAPPTVVTIVGGGLAGLLTALETLHTSPSTIVVLVEGGAALGGRVANVVYDDADDSDDAAGFGHNGSNTSAATAKSNSTNSNSEAQRSSRRRMVEVGATFIHGIEENPLVLLANHYGLKTKAVDYDSIKVIDAATGRYFSKVFVDAVKSRVYNVARALFFLMREQRARDGLVDVPLSVIYSEAIRYALHGLVGPAASNHHGAFINTADDGKPSAAGDSSPSPSPSEASSLPPMFRGRAGQKALYRLLRTDPTAMSSAVEALLAMDRHYDDDGDGGAHAHHQDDSQTEGPSTRAAGDDADRDDGRRSNFSRRQQDERLAAIEQVLSWHFYWEIVQDQIAPLDALGSFAYDNSLGFRGADHVFDDDRGIQSLLDALVEDLAVSGGATTVPTTALTSKAKEGEEEGASSPALAYTPCDRVSATLQDVLASYHRHYSTSPQQSLASPSPLTASTSSLLRRLIVSTECSIGAIVDNQLPSVQAERRAEMQSILDNKRLAHRKELLGGSGSGSGGDAVPSPHTHPAAAAAAAATTTTTTTHVSDGLCSGGRGGGEGEATTSPLTSGGGGGAAFPPQVNGQPTAPAKDLQRVMDGLTGGGSGHELSSGLNSKMESSSDDRRHNQSIPIPTFLSQQLTTVLFAAIGAADLVDGLVWSVLSNFVAPLAQFLAERVVMGLIRVAALLVSEGFEYVHLLCTGARNAAGGGSHVQQPSPKSRQRQALSFGQRLWAAFADNSGSGSSDLSSSSPFFDPEQEHAAMAVSGTHHAASSRQKEKKDASDQPSSNDSPSSSSPASTTNSPPIPNLLPRTLRLAANAKQDMQQRFLLRGEDPIPDRGELMYEKRRIGSDKAYFNSLNGASNSRDFYAIDEEDGDEGKGRGDGVAAIGGGDETRAALLRRQRRRRPGPNPESRAGHDSEYDDSTSGGDATTTMASVTTALRRSASRIYSDAAYCVAYARRRAMTILKNIRRQYRRAAKRPTSSLNKALFLLKNPLAAAKWLLTEEQIVGVMVGSGVVSMEGGNAANSGNGTHPSTSYQLLSVQKLERAMNGIRLTVDTSSSSPSSSSSSSSVNPSGPWWDSDIVVVTAPLGVLQHSLGSATAGAAASRGGKGPSHHGGDGATLEENGNGGGHTVAAAGRNGQSVGMNTPAHHSHDTHQRRRTSSSSPSSSSSPIGVGTRGTIRFTPPLPLSKREAIAATGCAATLKLALQFSTVGVGGENTPSGGGNVNVNTVDERQNDNDNVFWPEDVEFFGIAVPRSRAILNDTKRAHHTVAAATTTTTMGVDPLLLGGTRSDDHMSDHHHSYLFGDADHIEIVNLHKLRNKNGMLILEVENALAKEWSSYENHTLLVEREVMPRLRRAFCPSASSSSSASAVLAPPSSSRCTVPSMPKWFSVNNYLRNPHIRCGFSYWRSGRDGRDNLVLRAGLWPDGHSATDGDHVSRATASVLFSPLMPTLSHHHVNMRARLQSATATSIAATQSVSIAGRNRLIFAGEHTSPDLYGNMHGAVVEGQRAAIEVVALANYREELFVADRLSFWRRTTVGRVVAAAWGWIQHLFVGISQGGGRVLATVL